jgi:hypothetical protein
MAAVTRLFFFGCFLSPKREKIEDVERLGQLAIGPLHDQRFLLKSVDEELRYRLCSIKDQHEIAQR